MSPKFDGLEHFANFISEQIGRLEGKLDEMSRNFVLRDQFQVLKEDVDRAHDRSRKLEDRVHQLEIKSAKEEGEDAGRRPFIERLAAIGAAVIIAALLIALKLK